MTPKEKAEELLKKFALGGWPKENALIAVDEIIEEVRGRGVVRRSLYWVGRSFYWKEVKQEIEKI